MLRSQTPATNVVEDLSENISENLQESGQSDLPEELVKLSTDKVDLNSDDIDILVAAGLLTRDQCKDIRNHISKYGPLVEMEELQQVESVDKASILRILPYSTVYSKKDVQSRTTVTLRYQQSVIPQINYYDGSPSKIMARIRSVINSSLSTGFTFEKDEGESMFTKKNPAFDFNSFHLVYNGNKIIKRIIAGDYNVEIGQGLNLWSGISFGGSSTVTSVFKSGRGIVPYTGTDENRFFRGVAIAAEKNNFRLETWISHHAIDANVYTDPVTNNRYATSLLYSGYHRDYSEEMDYHAIKETSGGLHLKYKLNRFEAGFVSSTQSFNLPIAESDQPYKRFSFRGKINSINGFYYSYSFKNIILFGEESMSQKLSFATINGIIISTDPRFSLGILYRNYPADYQNLKANALGINSQNSNEEGLYLTFNYSVLRSLSYSSSVNVYSFPFLKYQINAPSKGNEILHQLDFKPNKKFTAQFRYRIRTKEEYLSSVESNVFSDNKYESIRFSGVLKIDNTWSYGTRIELIRLKSEGRIVSGGTMISQDIICKPMGKTYSFNVRYALFSCRDFETRIYEFENDVPGAFSVPFYYGNGSRFYLNVNYRLSRRMNVSMRYSKTWQDDPENYNSKSDIKFQLRINL
jgi:hypothetical protein